MPQVDYPDFMDSVSIRLKAYCRAPECKNTLDIDFEIDRYDDISQSMVEAKFAEQGWTVLDGRLITCRCREHNPKLIPAVQA